MPADVLTLARRKYVARQLLARRTVLAVRKAWQSIDSTSIRASWAVIVGPEVYRIVAGAQYEAAASAEQVTAAMLAAQGLTAPAAAVVSPWAFAGIASDGRDLMTLLELANLQALQALKAGLPARQALSVGGRFLELVTGTQVADAGRVADGVAVAARHSVTGSYRVLTPPSCSRCVVMAGKWYRWDAGFERHPRCDCTSVPGQDGSLDDHPKLWSPAAYFASLSRSEQDRTFTAAGAQALRDGAEMSQVVNARSGMRTASVGGRSVLITSTGTTRRGYYQYVQRSLDRRRGQSTTYTARNVGQRGRVANYTERRIVRPRLMPEQIYRIAAGDRDEAIRLLAGNGYLVGGVDQDAALAAPA